MTDFRHATTLHDILAGFNSIQQVPLQATHRDGGAVDRVVTKVDQ